MDINFNEVKIITQAMTMPVTSLALVGSFMAVMKPRLMEEADLESFPILVLHGQPKTGKSAVFKSAIPDKEDIKSTVDGYRKVNNYIKGNEVEYMLIDDVSNTDSYAKRQQYARIGDDLGRSAYQGDICVIGMTIEEGTLKFFPESGVQRMLIVSTDGFWNRENQKFVKKLRKSKKTLAKVIMEFRMWFEEQTTALDEELEMYEMINEDVMEYDTRIVHNTFAYFITLTYYFKFLKEVFPDVCLGLNIDVADVIRKLITPFFVMPKTEEMKRSEEFGHCYDAVLKSDALIAQKPIPEEVICKDYAFGKCEDCPGTYNFACSNTYFKMHKKYDAESLVIRNNYNCLFLEDIRNMIVFPKYLEKQGKQPVLLINKDILLELVNHVLLEKWKEQKSKIPLIRFSWIEVTEKLLASNRIMFFPEAKGKVRYSIPHYCETEDEDGDTELVSTSVVILRLTEAEARMFDDKTKYFSYYHRQHAYAESMGNRLSKYWFSLVAYGKIDDVFGA